MWKVPILVIALLVSTLVTYAIQYTVDIPISYALQLYVDGHTQNMGLNQGNQGRIYTMTTTQTGVIYSTYMTFDLITIPDTAILDSAAVKVTPVQGYGQLPGSDWGMTLWFSPANQPVGAQYIQLNDPNAPINNTGAYISPPAPLNTQCAMQFFPNANPTVQTYIQGRFGKGSIGFYVMPWSANAMAGLRCPEDGTVLEITYH